MSRLRMHHPGGETALFGSGRAVVPQLGRLWGSDDGVHWHDLGPEAPLATVRWRGGPMERGHPAAEETDEYLIFAGRAVGVRRPGEAFWVHPSGASAVAGPEGVRAAAAPGRSQQALPWHLEPSTLRFDPTGQRVAGVDAEGRGWWFDLLTRRATPSEGVPVGPGVHLEPDRGVLVGAPFPLALGPCSPCLAGDRLAGPGQRVWDLASAAAVSAVGSVALGACTPWRGGFVAVDWDRHEGRSVLAPPLAFRLPLDDDDMVDTLVASTDGALFATSLEGRAFRIDDGGAVREEAPEATDPAAAPGPVDTPLGRLPEGGLTQRGDRTYAWSASLGCWFDWISTPSTSAIS